MSENSLQNYLCVLNRPGCVHPPSNSCDKLTALSEYSSPKVFLYIRLLHLEHTSSL